MQAQGSPVYVVRRQEQHFWNPSLEPGERGTGGTEPKLRMGGSWGDALENGKCVSADFGFLGFDFKRRDAGWFRTPTPFHLPPPRRRLRWILELVMGVKLARGWGNSLVKKRISCLLSINIPTTATSHKTAEGPIK